MSHSLCFELFCCTFLENNWGTERQGQKWRDQLDHDSSTGEKGCYLGSAVKVMRSGKNWEICEDRLDMLIEWVYIRVWPVNMSERSHWLLDTYQGSYKKKIAPKATLLYTRLLGHLYTANPCWTLSAKYSDFSFSCKDWMRNIWDFVNVLILLRMLETKWPKLAK